VDVRTTSASVGTTVEGALEDQLITAVRAVDITNDQALRAAIQDALSAPARPADFTTAASRELVKGPGGAPATDAEIELATFTITPPDKFSISLDMEPADIVLQEN
jgi:hypothetical protein